MKIAIVSDTYLPCLGGGQIYCHYLAKFFKKNGFEVKIFTRQETKIKHDDYQDEFRVKRVVLKRDIFSRLNILYQMYNFLKDVDTVHAIYCYRFATFAAICKILSRKPLVITLEGQGILDLPQGNWWNIMTHNFYRWFSLKMADKIIASCREFEEIALKYADPRRIVYIPNAVDLTVLNTRVDLIEELKKKYSNKKVVLALRRLVPKNGIQFLIESASLIIRKSPEVKFVIVGWGRMENYLKKRVKELDIENYFDFLGRVENDQVANYLEISDIVVFPSSAESTSIACLEAMAMAKPIVASKVGGFFDMIRDGENGFLVSLVNHQYSDYDAPMDLPLVSKHNLASKITKLLKDNTLREEFGIKSYRIVQEKFNWAKNIKKIIKIHQNLLNV